MKGLQLHRLNSELRNRHETVEYDRDGRDQKSVGEIVSYEDLGIAPVFGSDGESVAFLSFYLDESYGKGRPDLVVGGFVSSVDRWAGFASRWKCEVQEQFKIPYFHMKELMDKRNYIYRHLSTQEKVRLFDTALTIIREHADFGVACRINPEEQAAITTSDERSFYGSAYTMAVYGCLWAIKDRLGEKVAGTTLDVFLEDGHRNTKQALGALQEAWRIQQGIDPSTLPFSSIWINQDSFEDRKQRELQYGTVALGTKAQMRPLQAADLLAYGVLNISGEPSPSEAFFTVVLNEIGSSAPIFIYDLTPEKIRKSLDTHLEKIEEGTEVRNQIARAVGKVGGKVRRHEGGFGVHFENPTNEKWRALGEALKSPFLGKPRAKNK